MDVALNVSHGEGITRAYEVSIFAGNGNPVPAGRHGMRWLTRVCRSGTMPMTMMSNISDHDTLLLRDRGVGATGISIVIADAKLPDVPVVDVNPAFERLTGYSPEDVLGRNCRFLQGPGSDPDVNSRMRTAIEKARHFNGVHLNYRRDGTPFWNEIDISPVYNGEGSPTHFVGLQQDVTERERASRHLQLLSLTSDIIAGGDQPEAVLKRLQKIMVPYFADYCTVHLRTEDDTIAWLSTTGVDSHTVREIERLERSMAHQLEDDSGVATVMRTGVPLLRRAPSADMFRETAKSDSYRRLLEEQGWKATLIIPIKAVDHVFGTMHFSQVGPGFPFGADDVKLAENTGARIGSLFGNTLLMHRAQSALVARERFLAIAAHELRTPVASIMGYAQLLSRSLERGTLTHHRLRQAIHTVEASVTRLSSLTDDLLDLSRRGSNEMPLRIDRIHTASFLTSVANRSSMLYAHPIVVDSTSAQGHFEGDISKIDQVMSNLLNNAAKYSDSDEPITIEAKTDDDGVRITVRDVGVGMAEEDLETIFELFGGSSRSRAPRISGFGLGLFVSRNIIERHGGKLWAESAGLGHGSSVNFWLPVSMPADSPAARDGTVDGSPTEDVESTTTSRLQ